jgi:hypothetical protein
MIRPALLLASVVLIGGGPTAGVNPLLDIAFEALIGMAGAATEAPAALLSPKGSGIAARGSLVVSRILARVSDAR